MVVRYQWGTATNHKQGAIVDNAGSISNDKRIVSIAAGEEHTVALRADGTVSAWGECLILGPVPITFKKREFEFEHVGDVVAGWADVTAISAGGSWTVGLRRDGTLLSSTMWSRQVEWEYQSDNVYYADTQLYRSDDWYDVEAVSVGRDGEGDNYAVGLLRVPRIRKDGRRDGSCLRVRDLYYGEEFDWTWIKAISAGFDHVLGLRGDGTVVARRCDIDYDWSPCSFGVESWKDVVSISAGRGFSLGLLADGRVVAAEHTFLLSSPKRKSKSGDGPTEVDGWREITAIAAGDSYSLGLRRDGTVSMAGVISSWEGREQDDRYVARWSDIVAIAAGRAHAVGLRADGCVLDAGIGYQNEYW